MSTRERDSRLGLPTTHYFVSISRGDRIRTALVRPAALWILGALAPLSLAFGLVGAADIALRARFPEAAVAAALEDQQAEFGRSVRPGRGSAAHRSKRDRRQDTRSRGASGPARAARRSPRRARRRGEGNIAPCPDRGRSLWIRRPRRHRDPRSQRSGPTARGGGEGWRRRAGLRAGRREPRAQSRRSASVRRDARGPCFRARPGGSGVEPGSRCQDPSRSRRSFARPGRQRRDQGARRDRPPGELRTRRAMAQF